MAHTPGPWNTEFKAGAVLIVKDDPARECIAQVVFYSSRDEANARLIAAAPDLLEALKQFVAAIDTAPPVDLINHIAAAGVVARAAINKATKE